PIPVASQLFFQPGDLGGEAADLGIERGELRLVRRFERAEFGALLKQTWQTFQRGRLPLAELGGMDAVLSGELRDRLLLFEEFVDDLSLESGRELLTHGYNPSRRGVPPHCPNSRVHYSCAFGACNTASLQDRFTLHSPLWPHAMIRCAGWVLHGGDQAR